MTLEQARDIFNGDDEKLIKNIVRGIFDDEKKLADIVKKIFEWTLSAESDDAKGGLTADEKKAAIQMIKDKVVDIMEDDAATWNCDPANSGFYGDLTDAMIAKETGSNLDRLRTVMAANANASKLEFDAAVIELVGTHFGDVVDGLDKDSLKCLAWSEANAAEGEGMGATIKALMEGLVFDRLPSDKQIFATLSGLVANFSLEKDNICDGNNDFILTGES